jgi:uncharacterized membrane protein
MNSKTRKLTITSLLAAICFVLGLTPVGYIPIPPISMTLLCLPVIIGTITEGLGVGLLLSLVFGITSFFKAIGLTMVPDPLGTYLLQISTIRTLVVIFIPRLLIPVTTWLVYRLIIGEVNRRQKVATGVAAFVGSMTNTVFFLGTMYLLFLPEIDTVAAGFETTPDLLLGVLAALGAINGLPEAAVAVLLCVPIVWALTKSKNKRLKVSEN